MNFSLGEPQTFSTISGVYRLKCRFRIWNTQCGFWSVGSFSAGPGLSDRTRSSNGGDRKSTRLNSSHTVISYAVFCLKKKKTNIHLIIPSSTQKVLETLGSGAT